MAWIGGPFDIISTDAGYRTVERAERFRDGIRAFVAQGKAQGEPVAITEFGCAAYRGAADMANRGDIVEYVFEAEGVDNVFVYTFARYDLAHRSAVNEDFDIASAGLVKVLEGRRGQRYPDML